MLKRQSSRSKCALASSKSTADIACAYPGRDRVHVLARAVTCPLAEVVDLFSGEGVALDYGCGHGLAAIRLALRHPSLNVLAVDIDDRKIGLAQAAARKLGLSDRVEFRTIRPGWLPAQPYDAILICDVLYLFEYTAAAELAKSMATSLTENGTLVIKGMSSSPAWKCYIDALQEMLSVRILGITIGEHLGRVPLEDLVALTPRATLVRLDSMRAHPHAALVVSSDTFPSGQDLGTRWQSATGASPPCP